MNITMERIQLLINLATDGGARSNAEREFVSCMAEGFGEMFGQQIAQANEKKKAELQAEINAKIAEEVKIREEAIRKELAEMHNQNGKVKN